MAWHIGAIYCYLRYSSRFICATIVKEGQFSVAFSSFALLYSTIIGAVQPEYPLVPVIWQGCKG